VNGVVLPLDGHVQLSVRLRSDQKIDGVSCSIEGVPLDGSPWGLSIVGRTGPDGVFTYDRAIPHRYALTAKCRPGSWAVGAIRIEGTAGAPDPLEAGLDLSSGPVAVDLVLTQKTGGVIVTVKDDDAPSPDRWVTLIPEPARPGRLVHEVAGWSDEEGRVLLQNVASGDYRIYAWHEISDSASPLNPGFLQRFAAQSTKLSVKAGERVQVEVKTVEP
jgi:hypothetical protein